MGRELKTGEGEAYDNRDPEAPMVISRTYYPSWNSMSYALVLVWLHFNDAMLHNTYGFRLEGNICKAYRTGRE